MDKRLHIGHYISGGAHVLLIGYALFGGVFSSEPEPPVVTGVDIITTEQFEALFTQQQPPVTSDEVEVPVAPELSDAPPAVVAEPDPVTPPTLPAATEAPEPEVTPEVEQPQPAPVDLAETPPVITPPAPPEVAPDQSTRPIARPVTRVAPKAVAPPEPDVQISDVDQAPTAPAETEAETVEAQEETARQEAAPEIPTEPKSGAVTSSVRPKARPTRPQTTQRTAPSSEPKNEEPQTANRDSGVNDALAQALAETSAAPSGPPLTPGERDGLKRAIEGCWIVDNGSLASSVTVVVGFSLTREGFVEANRVNLLSSTEGTEPAKRAAYDAARRAVLRCQKTRGRSGYEMPQDKYERWKNVEITFNPDQMRLR